MGNGSSNKDPSRQFSPPVVMARHWRFFQVDYTNTTPTWTHTHRAQCILRTARETVHRNKYKSRNNLSSSRWPFIPEVTLDAVTQQRQDPGKPYRALCTCQHSSREQQLNYQHCRHHFTVLNFPLPIFCIPQDGSPTCRTSRERNSPAACYGNIALLP